MKKDKTHILYYVASILFFLSVFIKFISGNDNSNIGLGLGLGSTFLALGSSYSKKAKEYKDED